MHDDIIYAQSLKDYICIHCADKKYVVHLTTKELESILPSDQFLRIHRSYIVNVGHIKTVEKNKISLPSITLPVGESFRHLVQQRTSRLI
jgi:two-component system LytT family response regulator